MGKGVQETLDWLSRQGGDVYLAGDGEGHVVKKAGGRLLALTVWPDDRLAAASELARRLAAGSLRAVSREEFARLLQGVLAGGAGGVDS